MTIERFRDVLSALGAPVAAREVAEMLWLASKLGVDGPLERPEAQGRAVDVHEEPIPATPDVHNDPQVGRERPGRPGRAGVEAPMAQPAAESDRLERLRELHLASTGPSDGANARSVLAPTAPMLRNALGIQRAVRPLKRRVASRTLSVLDEEATANRIASQPSGGSHWLPVMVPASERWLSLALIIDTAPSMRMWLPLARELRDTLLSVGAFRDLRVWYMREGQSSVEVGHSLSGAAGNGPSALVDPSGRQVIVVLSDCSGSHWWSERASEALHLWARGGPVAIFQPLPERLWHRTAAPALPGLATSSRPGAPNAELRFIPFDSATGGSTGSVPIPVLEPAQDWLADWARLVAGSGSQGLPTAVTYVSGKPSGKELLEQQEQQLSLEERVARFRSVASREAAELAAHIAVSFPALPVMRLIQQQFLPASRPAHLAEVLLSGLLRPVDAVPGMYEFVPGAREALLGILPRSESWHTANVLSRVSEAIERAAGRSADTFRAYASVAEGVGDYKLEVGARPFALVSPQALQALSHAPIAVHPYSDLRSNSGGMEFADTSTLSGSAETGGSYSHNAEKVAAASRSDETERQHAPESESPSLQQILSPDLQIVRFQGRESELEALKRWSEGRGIRMLVLTGAGGEGKTRLVLSLRTYLQEEGWATAELEKIADFAAINHQVGRPLCIFADNADMKHQSFNDNIAGMVANVSGTARFLLLARTAGVWWDALCQRIPDVVATEQWTLSPLMGARSLRGQSYIEAAQDFSDYLGLEWRPLVAPDLSDPDYGNALILHGSALLAVLRSAREVERSAVGTDEVGLWRHLAGISPRLFLPGFADALGNFGASLGARESSEGGLEATEEAIGLYRRLVQEGNRDLEPSLAQALSNFGEMLTRSDRFDEALAATEEAIQIRRSLCRERGSSHRPGLARALLGYAWVRARGNVSITKAVSAAEESIAIYEDLAQNSTRFSEDLVNARATLADLLERSADTGRVSAGRSGTESGLPTREELGEWVRWIENARFSIVRLRPGYTPKEVDNFLSLVRDTFLGHKSPPLTPAEVRKVQFSTRRGSAYDEEEVDTFLDEAEYKIARMGPVKIDDDTVELSVIRVPRASDATASVVVNETARWVENYQFSTTRLAFGYDEKEVDDFLDDIRDTFLGRHKPPLRSADVREKRFTVSRLRVGYDRGEVESFLEQAARKLSQETWRGRSG